jgi:hypothetical protein
MMRRKIRVPKSWGDAANDLHHRCGWSYADIARLFDKQYQHVWQVCQLEDSAFTAQRKEYERKRYLAKKAERAA